MPIISCLQKGALRELFIEHLGWDHARGSLILDVEGERLELEQVAQKRGFLVVRLVTSRPRAQTRKYIRAIQVKVARVAHEHLLVVADDKAQVQVWAWAYRDGNDGRVKHRLHPLFTDRIPSRLIERIKRLSVSLDEEEQFTLFDVTSRAREVLDSCADQEIFFRRPGYAQRGYDLALRMRDGGEAEFHEFVLFHQQMAAWYARRYRWITGDGEDMTQEAMAGLTRAAKQFDPDRGTAFSTYAFAAMRNECHRALPRLVALGRVPDYLYWPFRRVMRQWERRARSGGFEAGLDARDQACQEEGLSGVVFTHLYRAFYPVSLEAHCGIAWARHLGISEYTYEHDEIGRARTPLADLMLTEVHHILACALGALPRADAQIIRARFGFDAGRKTLQEIGDELGLTRERIRQREQRALADLQCWLIHEHPNDFAVRYGDDVPDGR